MWELIIIISILLFIFKDWYGLREMLSTSPATLLQIEAEGPQDRYLYADPKQAVPALGLGYWNYSPYNSFGHNRSLLEKLSYYETRSIFNVGV